MGTSEETAVAAIDVRYSLLSGAALARGKGVCGCISG
jgi:hypothetical protein